MPNQRKDGKKQIHAWVDEDLAKKLDALYERSHDRTRSGFLQRLVREALEQYKIDKK